MYTKSEPPVPYNENQCSNIFWTPDTIENTLKIPKGFITDWLFSLRGTEVPSIYTIWTALALISALVKRDAWFTWQDDQLYANLYVLLIGNPGMKKSMSIEKALKLVGENPFGGDSALASCATMLGNPIMYHKKKLNVIMDKATPEYLLDAMQPAAMAMNLKSPVDDKPLVKKNGDPVTFARDSDVFICAEELTSLINKKKYNETMVELLTELYNTKSVKHYGTKGESKKILRNLHTTFLAATTPVSFKESVPIVAASDGFLSRCIFVYKDQTHRQFSFPKLVPQAPSTEELRERLAWIACNTQGTHVFSEDAMRAYEKWYMKMSNQLKANPEAGKYRTRITQHTLKVALLLKAQRYDTSKVIKLDDFKLARYLVTETYNAMGKVISDMRATDYEKIEERVCAYIKKNQPVTRGKLLKNTKVAVKVLDSIIDFHVQSGDIDITLKGRTLSASKRLSIEEYSYSEEAYDD